MIELAGIGPAPHAAMILADHGADVVQVRRPGSDPVASLVHTQRSRTVVVADLKSDADIQSVHELVRGADVLIDPFRPGVAERLGLDPVELERSNPRLIVARMTGWGQTGQMHSTAGHDINFLALAGALSALGPASAPLPPLNLVADMGGGSMLLVSAILLALLKRTQTGRGEVLDVAMVDGVALLMQHNLELRGLGMWSTERGRNLLDGGAPYYGCYRCADGRFVAVGAIEPQFYSALVSGLDLQEDELPDRSDRAEWPLLRAVLSRRFLTRTRADWARIFEGTDACVTPVLDVDEAARNPHMLQRSAFAGSGVDLHASPAPRLEGLSAPRQPRVSDLKAEVERWAAS